jgi:uncharacterized membrane protein YqjE
MAETSNEQPGFATLARRLGKTVLGALENRGELFAVEWQQERQRLIELLIYSVALIFLAMLGVLLLTAAIIFLFPENFRVLVAAIFAVVYLGGAGAVFFGLKSLLKQEPFESSLAELRKDRALVDSFNE